MTRADLAAWAFVVAVFVLLRAMARTRLLDDPTPNQSAPVVPAGEEPSTAPCPGADAVPRTPAGSGRGNAGVTAGETAPVLRRNP
jgi:hypothetical protein